MSASSFIQSASGSFTNYRGISPENRNQFRGPGYFAIDMQLYKTFKLTERLTLGLGAQAFNVFNHPNYAVPDIGFGDSTFGNILHMAGTPTSPYGNVLGFDSVPRAAGPPGRVWNELTPERRQIFCRRLAPKLKERLATGYSKPSKC